MPRLSLFYKLPALFFSQSSIKHKLHVLSYSCWLLILTLSASTGCSSFETLGCILSMNYLNVMRSSEAGPPSEGFWGLNSVR